MIATACFFVFLLLSRSIHRILCVVSRSSNKNKERTKSSATHQFFAVVCCLLLSNQPLFALSLSFLSFSVALSLCRFSSLFTIPCLVVCVFVSVFLLLLLFCRLFSRCRVLMFDAYFTPPAVSRSVSFCRRTAPTSLSLCLQYVMLCVSPPHSESLRL